MKDGKKGYTCSRDVQRREGRKRKNLRDRNGKRKGDQIKESMHFEARKGRRRRDDHKQRETNKKQLLIQI